MLTFRLSFAVCRLLILPTMLTPRPSLASSKSPRSQASQTQHQVPSPSNRRRSQRRQYDSSCSRRSRYLGCGRSTSREICRCCYLAVPILEETTAGSWILELSAFDQVDPLCVISARWAVDGQADAQTRSTRTSLLPSRFSG